MPLVYVPFSSFFETILFFCTVLKAMGFFIVSLEKFLHFTINHEIFIVNREMSVVFGTVWNRKFSALSLQVGTLITKWTCSYCKKSEAYLPQESVWLAGGPTQTS
jgi:hypothetical protein